MLAGRAWVAAVLLGAGGCLQARTGSRSSGAPAEPEELAAESLRESILRRAIDEAARFLREGDLESAGGRIERIRASGVPARLEPTVAGLERLLEAETWRERLEGASRLDPIAPVTEAGETVSMLLRLKNEGPVAVSMRPASRRAAAAAGVLEVSVLERRADGTDLHEKEKRVFSVEALDLPAGGEATVPVLLPTSPQAAYALREVEVSVEVRPGRFAAGGRELPLARLRLGPCRFRVCPPGYGPIVAGPLESLRRALAAPSLRFDRHVLLAAAFVAAGEREEAVSLCRAALSSPEGRRRQSAAAALRILLGRDDLPADPDLWRSRLGSVASVPAPP